MANEIKFDRTKEIMNITNNLVNNFAKECELHKLSIAEVVEVLAVTTDSMLGSLADSAAEDGEIEGISDIHDYIVKTYVDVFMQLHEEGKSVRSAEVSSNDAKA